MSKFIESVKRIRSKCVNKLINGLLSQEQEGGIDPNAPITNGMPQLLRELATEGAVLLKNDNNALPLKEKEKVAVFGRVQADYFYCGYGSGGSVKVPYKISLLEALKKSNINFDTNLASVYEKYCKKHPVDDGFWGHWPRCYPELTMSGKKIQSYAQESMTAVYVIGRSAGEDRENALTKGSYYLTKQEEDMLVKLTNCFEKVIVILNIGNIIDMEWTLKYKDKISAILIAWQGGMESGNAICDILCGAANPSGKLTDTIAINYDDYPSAKHFGNRDYNEYYEDIYVGYRYFETFKKDRVLYPFGYGLSYTTFEIKNNNYVNENGLLTVELTVKNTGTVAGKEVVQLYVKKPQGKLGQPSVQLIGYAKTQLIQPNNVEQIVLQCDYKTFASYDEDGRAGAKNCYVLEEGEYSFYIGNDVRHIQLVFTCDIAFIKYEQLNSICPVQNDFTRLTAYEKDGKIMLGEELVKAQSCTLRKSIINNLPQSIVMTGDKGYTIDDIKSGKITIDEFVAQLDLVELEALTRGDYTMRSPLGASGNAGCYGGVLPSLMQKGIKPIITTDGPSGIRLSQACSLLPIGTLMACSWNNELIQTVYSKVAEELEDRGSDVLLAPGMNIHRNVLCGRNFEYFSEDPYLSGYIASSVIKGIQSNGRIACPKHFACNNQEVNRTKNDSRVSERALREIYLKGFEIAVTNANPKNIMTSYNKINGIWSHYNYYLCSEVLRREWGYKNLVITDWWMQSSVDKDFELLRDNAYRVRAQVDVLMPGGARTGKRVADNTLLESLGKEYGITLGEIQLVAKRIVELQLANKQ